MTSRIASLTLQASTLCRRIYASLPFAIRLANFFTVLAGDAIDAWGRALGAEFIIQGVTGMPDPGPRWNPKAKNPALTLPEGYLRSFATKLYSTLMRKFHNPSLVEETLQEFIAKLLTTHKIQPLALEQAEVYVIRGAILEGLSLVRDRRVGKPTGMDSLDDFAHGEEGRKLEETVEDPHAFAEMHRELSPRVWKLWMAYLARNLHEDIPEYIQYSMAGYNNLEIIGAPLKGPGYEGMLTHYKPPTRGNLPNGAANSFLYHYVLPGGPKGGITGQSKKFFTSLGEKGFGAEGY